jgi:hypothetical protein
VSCSAPKPAPPSPPPTETIPDTAYTFPHLPSSVPLTYTLLMKACLSSNPLSRPSFSQVLTILSDVSEEVLRGCYINSEGWLQVRSTALIPNLWRYPVTWDPCFADCFPEFPCHGGKHENNLNTVFSCPFLLGFSPKVWNYYGGCFGCAARCKIRERVEMVMFACLG